MAESALVEKAVKALDELTEVWFGRAEFLPIRHRLFIDYQAIGRSLIAVQPMPTNDRMFRHFADHWIHNLPDAPEEMSRAVPKNNDGRSSCWWCKEPTVRKKGFTDLYDFCESCQR